MRSHFTKASSSCSNHVQECFNFPLQCQCSELNGMMNCHGNTSLSSVRLWIQGKSRCVFQILFLVLSVLNAPLSCVFQAQEVYLDICPNLDPSGLDRMSGARSVSSHSSRKSSHTALSDTACQSPCCSLSPANPNTPILDQSVPTWHPVPYNTTLTLFQTLHHHTLT